MKKLYSMLFLSLFLANVSLTTTETNYENFSKASEVYHDALSYEQCPSCRIWNEDGTCRNKRCPLYGQLTC